MNPIYTPSSSTHFYQRYGADFLPLSTGEALRAGSKIGWEYTATSSLGDLYLRGSLRRLQSRLEGLDKDSLEYRQTVDEFKKKHYEDLLENGTEVRVGGRPPFRGRRFSGSNELDLGEIPEARILSGEEATRLHGIKDRLSWSETVTNYEAMILNKKMREDILFEWKMSRARGLKKGLSLGSSLITTMFDPLFIPAFFFTPLKLAQLSGAAKVIKAAGIKSKVGQRAIQGAIPTAEFGAAGEIPLQFSTSWRQQDYTALDSMANIAFGTALGASIVPFAGALGDFLAKGSKRSRKRVLEAFNAARDERTMSTVDPEALELATKQMLNNQTVEVEAVVGAKSPSRAEPVNDAEAIVERAESYRNTDTYLSDDVEIPPVAEKTVTAAKKQTQASVERSSVNQSAVRAVARRVVKAHREAVKKRAADAARKVEKKRAAEEQRIIAAARAAKKATPTKRRAKKEPTKEKEPTKKEAVEKALDAAEEDVFKLTILDTRATVTPKRALRLKANKEGVSTGLTKADDVPSEQQVKTYKKLLDEKVIGLNRLSKEGQDLIDTLTESYVEKFKLEGHAPAFRTIKKEILKKAKDEGLLYTSPREVVEAIVDEDIRKEKGQTPREMFEEYEELLETAEQMDTLDEGDWLATRLKDDEQELDRQERLYGVVKKCLE